MMIWQATRPLLLMVAGVFAAGCGGGSGARPDDGGADRAPEQPFLYRSCALGQKVGEIKVALEKDFTAVGGSIARAVIPADVRELVMESDGCRLLRKRRLQCLPGCVPGETCGEGGRCITYPENVSAGTITISGLAGPVHMMPRGTTHNYWDTTLPHPGFQPGAEIRLEATGGDLRPFALRGWGVSPLFLPDQTLRLEKENAFELRWEPGSEGPARVQLTISVDQHAVTPAALVCEGSDTGVMIIPGALVTALLAAGASGYPTALLARQTVDSIAVAEGCAEFVIATGVERSLTVAGHLPCRTNTDCPPGTTCATQLQTCL